MTYQISQLQKLKIKEMVDEIIVNGGVLTIADRQAVVDGMDINELSRLAFKYYKMIYLGQDPLDVDIPTTGRHKTVKRRWKPPADRCCIGCEQPLLKDDIDKEMPVCRFCREKLKADYEMLRELLH